MDNMDISLTYAKFDRNKDYYLSNDGQTIKEAGFWHKFQCLFNIGNAREKGANLIAAINRSLQSKGIKSSHELDGPDQSVVRGQALNIVAKEFTAKNSSLVARYDLKLYSDSKVDEKFEIYKSKHREHKPILEKPGVEKKLKGFLRQSIASLINNPPHRIDQNGIYVYKSQEFRKELETKLTSAIQDMSGFLKKSTQLNQRDGNVLAALAELDKSLEEKQTEFENDQAEVSKFMQKIEEQTAVLDAIIQKVSSAEKKAVPS